MTSGIQSQQFANGFTLITHVLPGARGAAIGLWLLNGSRHEAPKQHGYAHLLEHLFFKGAGERDAATIARLTDRWGGLVNAFTGRELTALHGLVPGAQAGALVELLVEMVLDPRFSDEDLKAEQGVIIQEMAGHADSPDEAVETRALELACGDNPMGRDILGTQACIEASSVRGLHRYRHQLLRGRRLALVAVGAIDPEALAAACAPLAALPEGRRPATTPPAFSHRDVEERHDSGQAHLVWVMPAPAAYGRDHAAGALCDHLLGGGASSRLFQQLRERQGLVYDVRSGIEAYADSGIWIIQTACRPRDLERCRRAVEAVLTELLEKGPQVAELDDAREHIGASLVLEYDHLEAHMERLAREYFYLGRHPTLSERLAEIEAVSTADVRGLLAGAWAARTLLVWRP